MANLQTSTAHFSVDTPSTSTRYPNYYFDVFISHRGPDVKNTFATHLYRELRAHGLHSFLDREELQAGEVLSPQIEDAISAAYIHIVIFSPGYADSPWCLDELLCIMGKSEDVIIPVFYNVKPSELRWTETRTGQYAEALSKHVQKGRYDPQTVENWRKALKDASDRVGFELGACNGDEGRLLDNVVQCVLKKRRKIGLDVARYPTGLDEKVEDFEKTLSLQQHQSGKAKVMGIVGMGGVGKTTLAKQLFNKKGVSFGESCFLPDVRENACRRSLNSLQTKLIKDITHRDVHIDDVDQGIEMLKTYLSTSKHALVVLDDVDNADQLHKLFSPITEVLRSDSLVLVTSRDKDVLTSSGIRESSIYRLTGLNKQHSQELFCSHAFCHPHPPPDFKDLVDKFCRACDRLPLSLKVYGGLLCEKDKSYWEGVLNKLRQIKLPNEITQTLRLSYDALEEEEKKIFLDIASFFIGEERDMAIRIWDGSGWNGSAGLVNLENRCLVEVGRENNRIKMHDHLRDLGREIADQTVIPRRLWRLTEDINDLWKESTVITEVRGIRTVHGLIYPSDIQKSGEILSWLKSWCEEVFENCRKMIDTTPHRFRKLQLVAAEDGDITSILRRVKSPDLIWLRWNNCPFSCLPSWIRMKNIRVLEVVGKKLKTLWLLESQAPLELRELYVAAPLLEFPKFIRRLKHLEKIVVEKSNLKSLPRQFGYLQSLKYLCINDADLVSLPDSFGCLTNLQHLKLVSCRRLLELPYNFSCLENLESLNLSACSNLRWLPHSFERLTNLEHLDLSMCSNLELSGDFPPNLRCLNVNDCPLQQNRVVAKALMDIATGTASNTISSAIRLPLIEEHIHVIDYALNNVPRIRDDLMFEKERGLVQEQLNRMKGLLLDIQALFRDQQREVPAALENTLLRMQPEVVEGKRLFYELNFPIGRLWKQRYSDYFLFLFLFLSFSLSVPANYFLLHFLNLVLVLVLILNLILILILILIFRFCFRFRFLFLFLFLFLSVPHVRTQIREWNTTVNGILNELSNDFLLICNAPQIVSRAAPQQDDVPV